MLHGFSFALVVGIIVGTYSSIFIASPIVLFWHNWSDARKRRGGGRGAAGGEAAPAAASRRSAKAVK